MNALLPARVAERYRAAKIVAFSSGNIYPFMPATSGGATEDVPVCPVGEYAQSVLARERVFEHYSKANGTPSVMLRLNYAIDLRYGVLRDIALKVYERRPVDVAMGLVNVIWQGDANSVALRAFSIASAPTSALNLTGPETLSVRWIAQRFARLFGVEAEITGQESPNALLNNSARCHRLFGYPTVSVEEMIDWTAAWILAGGRSLNKPTHFETRDGKF
jgi:nucleoside-diphosphate-sugar epimerase